MCSFFSCTKYAKAGGLLHAMRMLISLHMVFIQYLPRSPIFEDLINMRYDHWNTSVPHTSVLSKYIYTDPPSCSHSNKDKFSARLQAYLYLNAHPLSLSVLSASPSPSPPSSPSSTYSVLIGNVSNCFHAPSPPITGKCINYKLGGRIWRHRLLRTPEVGIGMKDWRETVGQV